MSRSTQNYYTEYRTKSIEEIIAALPSAYGGGEGSSLYHFLHNLLFTRLSESLAGALKASTETTGKSANLIGIKIDVLVMTLGEVGNALSDAANNIKQVTDVRALEIVGGLGKLTDALDQASQQSTRFGRRLNWLTAALLLAAGLTAGATIFYAWETKRQVDLSQQQLQQHTAPNSPATPPKQ